jgi:hypothetical protein
MTQVPRTLSERIFTLASTEDCAEWIRDVDEAVGGLTWKNLGGEEDNVHTVEVASDPAAALVERVTNAIDAMLDLEMERHSDAPKTPRAAAELFFGVPSGGVSALSMPDRQRLANNIRIANIESGKQDSPTVEVQDGGVGQHPDEFEQTLVSLHRGNKKSKKHQMGVYNAGSAATYAFCSFVIIVSRRAPDLLGGRTDEIGMTIVRYNELDPERFKSGTYEFAADTAGTTLRLDLEGGCLPDLPHGTYVKHVNYELAQYSRAAHEPKASLHHLFNAALPDPALPFWIEEKRVDRFPGVREKGERRGVYGLVARMEGSGTADYQDERGPLSLGADNGSITIRYFVLNDGQEPDAFVTARQQFSLLLNGQRQGSKDRSWIKRNTSLNYIAKRLIVLVDCSDLTSAAKRQLFASTREASKESKLAEQILERVLTEIKDDDELYVLDEQARERTLASASRATSERVKRQLATRIASLLAGQGGGRKGGTTGPKPRPPRPPRPTDDSGMLEIPDTLRIENEEPIVLRQGRTTPLIVHINAKNGFLPLHQSALKVVIGADLKDRVRLRATGRLLGGMARLTLEADPDCPLASSDVTVTLVDPELGLVLTDKAKLTVAEPKKGPEPKHEGGGPDIDFTWIGRAGWSDQDPVWDDQTAGICVVSRGSVDGRNDVVTRAEFRLNENFGPLEAVERRKQVQEAALERFRDTYATPLCWALFEQELAEWAKEHEADEQGESVEIDDSYVRGEHTRVASAILMAMEPDIAASIEAERDQ